MIEMEIDNELLCSYLSKVICEEAKIKINDNGWGVQGNDTEEVSFCNATLYKKAFLAGSYPVIEKEITVPIPSFTLLLNALQRFNGKVKIKIDKNYFVATNEKKVFSMQLAELVGAQKFSLPDLEYNGQFKASAKFFKEAIANSKLIEQGKDAKFYLQVKEKQLEIKTGSIVNSFTEKTAVDFKDVKGVYKAGFANVFARLDGSLQLSMKEVEGGYPLKVSYEKKGVMEVDYYISPFDESEQPTSEEENDSE